MNQYGELFDPASVTQDSPRLAWMKKHGLMTHEDVDHYEGSQFDRWTAYTDWLEGYELRDTCGRGATEHDSIVDWAVRHGVKLWNEESA